MFHMQLPSALFAFGVANVVQSGGEALDAWLPTWFPSVMASRYSLTKLDSNTRRIQNLSALLPQNSESGGGRSLSAIKIVAEKSGDVARAHGNLANGVIGLDPQLIAHQNENPKIYAAKHVLENCSQEKASFDQLLIAAPDTPQELTVYLQQHVTSTEIESWRKHLKFLTLDLNEDELRFVLEHERGHLTYQDRKNELMCSTALRFIAMGTAEVMSRICLPQISLAYYAAHLAGYLLSRCALATLVQHKHECRADLFAAKEQKQAAGGVRWCKRMLIIEWIGQQLATSTEGKRQWSWSLENVASHPSFEARLSVCVKQLSSSQEGVLQV